MLSKMDQSSILPTEESTLNHNDEHKEDAIKQMLVLAKARSLDNSLSSPVMRSPLGRRDNDGYTSIMMQVAGDDQPLVTQNDDFGDNVYEDHF